MESHTNKRLELYLLFRRVSKCITKEISTNLKKLGTTDPQFGVLRTLYNQPVASMGEISEWVLTCNANMTSLIDRMENSGLIERVAHEIDRRVRNVTLTEKGKRLAERTIEPHRAYVTELFSKLSNEDLEELERILKKLEEN